VGAAMHIDTSDLSSLELKGGLLRRSGKTLLVEFIQRGSERIGHVRQIKRALDGPELWRWEIDAFEVIGETGTRDSALGMAAYFLQQERAR
jgi:hypothetical protein